MAERKVLNKYYPPDFNPDILPRGRGGKFRQFCIRTMAPFNMRCNTCGEFIYKGKKFNSRKETVRGENYLGLDIYRFYIRCTRCLAEITYTTDPENTDYKIEHGATRNFEAETVLKKLEDQKLRKLEEELIQNPMKILENRTKESQMEMEILENLEELKELNARNYIIDHDALLHQHVSGSKKIIQIKRAIQEESEEMLLKKILAEQKQSMKRLVDDDDDDVENQVTPVKHVPTKTNSTNEKKSTIPLKKKNCLSKMIVQKVTNNKPLPSKIPQTLLVSYDSNDDSD